MEFLLLILIGMFGYFFYRQGSHIRLIAIVPFLIYVLYRFISRTRILWDAVNNNTEETAEPDDKSGTKHDKNHEPEE